MHTTCICIFLTILTFTVTATATSLSADSAEPHRNCVLNSDGNLSCVPSIPLAPSIRMSASAPCTRNDVMCWCKKAKDYTNDVRRNNGVGKMLKLGTKKQMDNAMRYAKKLGGMGFLKHQVLSRVTREVGCQRWMGGENLAFNYEQGDIAKMCVEQWVNSKGHFENLIRDWFEEVVIGFHFQPDGRVYCVQTFALPYPRGTFGSPGDDGCQLVGGDSAPTPTNPAPSKPSPSPSPSSSPKPSTKPEPVVTIANTPAPRRKNLSSPQSCKCIRYGKGCRPSIARDAKNGCVARTQRSKQPMSCKRDCCDFCQKYPDVGLCAHRHLVRICGKL